MLKIDTLKKKKKDHNQYVETLKVGPYYLINLSDDKWEDFWITSSYILILPFFNILDDII